MEEEATIPKDVLEAIKTVRDTGLTNMFDSKEVARLCVRLTPSGRKAADWIVKNRKLYATLIFEGPESFKITE